MFRVISGRPAPIRRAQALNHSINALPVCFVARAQFATFDHWWNKTVITRETIVMRITFLAVATAFAISLVATAPGHAQRSVNDLFNRCVQLAMQRGYSTNDLDGGNANRGARNFVIRCMQGRQK
jgi:hypothetical protein